MLHISETIELIVRSKRSRFTKDLWKGLLMALSIHGVLFFAFRIVSQPVLDALPPLTPIAIEIDLRKVHIEDSVVQVTTCPMEKLSPPQFPVESFSPRAHNEIVPLRKIPIEESDFSEIEQMHEEIFYDSD